ncbi:cobalamin-binding protein [Halopseudomonas pelagia]|uniref:cobalamin-binding protein n=1 Tax=Halopseudomonas pelagia TaxID=553151 RepID=UPI0003A74A91|nr:cobalamin-binding protein [Halopseudomonas pelagia]
MRAGWLAGLLLLSLPLAAAPRVVSLAPFLTDMLVQLDAADQLVGVLDDGQLPVELDAIPLVGRHQSLSLELILAQQPDLVLAWISGNPPELLNALETWGVRVERFDPQRLADIADMTRRLGDLLDVPVAAEALVADYERDLNNLQRPLATDAPRVFIQLWDEPLYTVSDNQLIGDALRHCGARNVFGDLPILAPQVGRESVIAADPDIIIVFSDEPAQANSWLESWFRFPKLGAVRSGRLHVLDGDNLVRPTPQIVEGLADLCGVIWRDS